MTDDKATKRSLAVSPREFLRSRRPERFSDSHVETGPVLDRAVLEYHLESLTSRSQEGLFERFARKLAERELCPNLVPPTGPTGGGDSKADTETYPVADQLSLGWAVGTGRDAANERWAFAFSAMKAWQPKVKSDIAKIAATGRPYAKAFFVTNQYVPSKKRSQLEDELRTKHGLDVRIFDRTWILDRVFAGGHEQLAVDELEIGVSLQRRQVTGPRDQMREAELKETEARIAATLQTGGSPLHLCDDATDAAILARELSRPRTEVDGLWLRAERIASEHGTRHQRVRAAYERAWTAYWWHEDLEECARLYPTVAGAAAGTDNVYDLELLGNLWTVLQSAAHRGDLDPTLFDATVAAKELRQELRRFLPGVERPSAALQARTQLAMMDLLVSLDNPDAALGDLREIVAACEGLVGFALEPLAQMVQELGETPVGQNPAYEALFDLVVSVSEQRTGEVSGARMLVGRGLQLLQADRPYDAIKHIGRALRRLYRHESRGDLVRALYACARAYREVGLLWAARGTLLTAASIATSEFHVHSELTPPQAWCYEQLKWLELELGRVPQALQWHELHVVVASALAASTGGDRTGGDDDFDAAMGMLMLRATHEQLAALSRLPNVLGSLALPRASTALMYALGYEEEVRRELGEAIPADEFHEFFERWATASAGMRLPVQPVLGNEDLSVIRGVVLGCEVVATAESGMPCPAIAESITAALEALAATLLTDRVVPVEPTLRVDVRIEEESPSPFESELTHDDDGVPLVRVRASQFNPNTMGADLQSPAREQTSNAVLAALSALLIGDSVEETLTRIVREDLALERAIGFTSSYMVIGNVLGSSPKTSIRDWTGGDVAEFPPRRATPLSSRLPTAGSGWVGAKEPPSGSAGAAGNQNGPPRAPKTHHDMQILSPIRNKLWDEAGWIGTGVVAYPGVAYPPILTLVFRNPDAAGRIFEGWRAAFGREDTENRLRVAIILGIDRQHPYSYRVAVSMNPSSVSGTDPKLTLFGVRMQQMDATSHRNLDMLREQFALAGAYLLSPATVGDSMPVPLPGPDRALLKRELIVKHAWEIGPGDIDAIAIRLTDDPVIPEGVVEPPVVQVLKRWRSLRAD